MGHDRSVDRIGSERIGDVDDDVVGVAAEFPYLRGGGNPRAGVARLGGGWNVPRSELLGQNRRPQEPGFEVIDVDPGIARVRPVLAPGVADQQ